MFSLRPLAVAKSAKEEPSFMPTHNHTHVTKNLFQNDLIDVLEGRLEEQLRLLKNLSKGDFTHSNAPIFASPFWSVDAMLEWYVYISLRNNIRKRKDLHLDKAAEYFFGNASVNEQGSRPPIEIPTLSVVGK